MRFFLGKISLFNRNILFLTMELYEEMYDSFSFVKVPQKGSQNKAVMRFCKAGQYKAICQALVTCREKTTF